jgi:DNA-binding GntR family transcriptional regulator
VTVAKPTLEEAKEIFEVRRALEREAVRLTIARWRPAFVAELRLRLVANTTGAPLLAIAEE